MNQSELRNFLINIHPVLLDYRKIKRIHQESAIFLAPIVPILMNKCSHWLKKKYKIPANRIFASLSIKTDTARSWHSFTMDGLATSLGIFWLVLLAHWIYATSFKSVSSQKTDDFIYYLDSRITPVVIFSVRPPNSVSRQQFYSNTCLFHYDKWRKICLPVSTQILSTSDMKL